MKRLNSFYVCASCLPFTTLRKVYQMGSGFSRFWMVDFDFSRRFCPFHLKICADFTQFTRFGRIRPNGRKSGSRFGHEPMVDVEMRLPPLLLPLKRWKFARCVSALWDGYPDEGGRCSLRAVVCTRRQESEAAGSHHPTLALSHEVIGVMDADEK